MGDPRPQLLPSGLTREQERAAWAQHNRESILSDLALTPAERFQWLEEAQLLFHELHPDQTFANTPPPSRKRA